MEALSVFGSQLAHEANSACYSLGAIFLALITPAYYRVPVSQLVRKVAVSMHCFTIRMHYSLHVYGLRRLREWYQYLPLKAT